MANQRITNDQRKQFFRDGYLLLRNVVPKQYRENALRKINLELGKGVSPADMEKANKSTNFPHLVVNPAITNLYHSTELTPIVSELIGKPVAAFGGQIALRFPGYLCVDDNAQHPLPYWNKAWHIDGMPDGVTQQFGTIKNFTCLVGVYLSDTDADFAGNLVVYPGSHRIIQQYFKKNGCEGVKARGIESLPPLPLSAPVQIRAKPGDVVIAHYQLAHSVAPNTSGSIRYGIYFRVNVRKDEEYHPEPLKDIWLDWPGMKNTVEQCLRADSSLMVGSSKLSPGRPADKWAQEKMQHSAQAQKLLLEAKKQLASKDFKKASATILKVLQYDEIFDYEMIVGAGATLTFQPGSKYVKVGEQCFRKCIETYAILPYAYAYLASNLSLQKRHKEIFPVIQKMVDCPKISTDKDKPDWLFHGLKVALELANASNQSALYQQFVNKAKQTYPEYADEIDKVQGDHNPEFASLEQQAKDFFVATSQGKIDLQKGISIFSRLVEIQPDHYWYTAILGELYNWDVGLFKNNRPRAERILRKAITLDPKNPYAYCVLIINLDKQKRKDQIIPLALEMLDTSDASMIGEQDHIKKVKEAMQCVRSSTTNQDIIIAVINQARQKFTQIKDL